MAAVEPAGLDALRSLIGDSIGKHMYDNAVFFADKLVALSGGAPDDVYRLAQAYVFTKQWRRALALLRKHNLSPGEPRFRYLTAKCLAEAQEWDECLSLLGDDVLQVVANADGGGIEGQVGMHAAMQLLKGSVYELQENWPLAARCYTTALKAEPFCAEALDRLVSNHMLSAEEQEGLLRELEPQLRGPNAEWLRLYYRCKLGASEGRNLAAMYVAASDADDGAAGGAADGGAAGAAGSAAPSAAPAAAAGAALHDDVELMSVAAEYEYEHGHFSRCYALTKRTLSLDPFRLQVLPTHLCAMVRLSYHAELFYLAHQLVEEYPQQVKRAVSAQHSARNSSARNSL